ncbi:MAG TPA: NUDIX hydrolase, partial [Candidatus Limnocylindria bacterium]|nr:NUDIX hydrolase [Candidatus Limnocylindria bacterium]
LMRPIGGDLSLHDHEFDEVRWVQLEEALQLMSYATERDVVTHAGQLLAGEAPRDAVNEAPREARA